LCNYLRIKNRIIVQFSYLKIEISSQM